MLSETQRDGATENMKCETHPNVADEASAREWFARDNAQLAEYAPSNVLHSRRLVFRHDDGTDDDLTGPVEIRGAGQPLGRS